MELLRFVASQRTKSQTARLASRPKRNHNLCFCSFFRRGHDNPSTFYTSAPRVLSTAVVGERSKDGGAATNSHPYTTNNLQSLPCMEHCACMFSVLTNLTQPMALLVLMSEKHQGAPSFTPRPRKTICKSFSSWGRKVAATSGATGPTASEAHGAESLVMDVLLRCAWA